MRFTRAPHLPPLLLELKKSKYYETSGTVLGGYLILLITISSCFLERENQNCQFSVLQNPQKTDGFHEKTGKN
jgi:hypothetical protein